MALRGIENCLPRMGEVQLYEIATVYYRHHNHILGLANRIMVCCLTYGVNIRSILFCSVEMGIIHQRIYGSW